MKPSEVSIEDGFDIRNDESRDGVHIYYAGYRLASFLDGTAEKPLELSNSLVLVGYIKDEFMFYRGNDEYDYVESPRKYIVDRIHDDEFPDKKEIAKLQLAKSLK